MQRILITGGAGFIGANLAIFLKKCLSDTHIIILDNLHRRGAELNIPRLSRYSIEFIHGDIRIESDLENIPPCEWIIECSAEPSALAGYESSPKYVVQSNLSGAINCLNWAKIHSAGFLFLSTSRVYPYTILNSIPYISLETRLQPDFQSISLEGFSKQGISERFPLQGIRTLYGATKLASELIAQEYTSMFDIPLIINRCSVIAGPWQMGRIDQGIIALWLAYHFTQTPLTYIGYGGKGKQVRDALHIEDLCELVLIQLTYPAKFMNQIFNVGGGMERSFSLQELTQHCKQIVGKSTNIYSEPQTRKGDVPYFVTDTSLIQSLCNWKPQKSLVHILEDTYKWIIDHKEQLKGILLPIQTSFT